MFENTENASSFESFVNEFGTLGHLSQAKLYEVLRGVDAADKEQFVTLCRDLWTPGMLGWEKVEIAGALATLPGMLRAFFVTAVQVIVAQSLLNRQYAPQSVGANALRAVVRATASVDPNDYGAWTETCARLCAGPTEYFDAPHVIAALATLPASHWASFATTVETVCPPQVDSHNRTQIITMLAQTKLASEERSALLEACAPAANAAALRATVENFLGNVGAPALA